MPLWSRARTGSRAARPRARCSTGSGIILTACAVQATGIDECGGNHGTTRLSSGKIHSSVRSSTSVQVHGVSTHGQHTHEGGARVRIDDLEQVRTSQISPGTMTMSSSSPNMGMASGIRSTGLHGV